MMSICTGARCPAQVGYDVKKCKATDCPYRTPPMTNADRIRNLSDEELADLLYNFGSGFIVEGGKTEIAKRVEKMHIEYWLKQPYKECE